MSKFYERVNEQVGGEERERVPAKVCDEMYLSLNIRKSGDVDRLLRVFSVCEIESSRNQNVLHSQDDGDVRETRESF